MILDTFIMSENQNTKPGKTGILIVQLGTPDDATPAAVRRFLREFLSDKYVVDTNRVLWFFILNFIILRTRPKKSAKLYERLFERYGPVIRTYTTSLTEKIQNEFDRNQSPCIVRSGMRYGNPSLKKVLTDMIENQGCEEILVVPLFPQYSQATSATIYEAVMKQAVKSRFSPAIRFMSPFYNKRGYVESLSQMVNSALSQRLTPPEKIIFSYHGIPKRYVQKGDPYEKMCLETTELLKQRIDYPSYKILHTYQSRFGPEEWLTPATDQTLIDLAKNQITDVMILCPGFTMDCLETLDEIGVESRKIFVENGGQKLELLSCLNDSDLWAAELFKLIENDLQGWV